MLTTKEGQGKFSSAHGRFHTLRAILALCSLSAGVGLEASAQPPQPDASGNFGRTPHKAWVVTDSSGALNCRMDASWHDAWYANPMELDAEPFGLFESVSQFPRGARLEAEFNLMGSSVWADVDGKSWLGVKLQSGEDRSGQNLSFCFVRANSRYVRPVE